jgi:hypothetical protein
MTDMRRRRSPWGAGVVAVLALGACRPGAPEVELPPAQPELSAAELGRLGGHVFAEPERIREILAEAELTPTEFRARVRAIEGDTAASREYGRGFEEALRRPPER